ncbi:hypothetical protein EEB14_08800 [Rhodococcus sp. WS4]|nr:hypothetical protein EEB14_08800 [Rhodococcus sp. WS4]
MLDLTGGGQRPPTRTGEGTAGRCRARQGIGDTVVTRPPAQLRIPLRCNIIGVAVVLLMF